MFSTSAITGLNIYNDSYFFIKRSILFTFIGFIALIIGYFIPKKILKSITPFGLFFSFILMCLCFTPLGSKVGGANRWINTGLFNLQPIELTKCFLVLYISTIFENKKKQIKCFKSGILPILCIFSSIIVVLLIQPDLGNTALVMMVLISLLFLSSIPLWQLMGIVLSALSIAIISILLQPYQMNRILGFLSPDLDPFGKTYHISQSLLSIGSGGLWGVGLGQSKLKFFYLPLQYSDFIFSIICEEGGFILATSILCLFLFFLFKSIYIAQKNSSIFASYTIMGLSLFICYQAFINIGAVIGLLPITGIPLSFISFGGSSLITSLFYLGIILNMSLYHQKNNEQ